MVIFYLCVVITLLIVVIHLALLVGVLANRVRDVLFRRFVRKVREEKLREVLVDGKRVVDKLKVSVIIAARDEEANLPKLIDSLKDQTDKDFEIVFVNDRSTDRTGEILKRFADEMPERVKVVNNTREPVNCNPKQFALDLGIEVATGDIFLFSDADCEFPETWVEYYRYYFMEESVKLVFGQVMVRNDGSFLQRYQAFDQMLIHQYNSGSAGLGIPTGCFGNNLAVRREVMESIGGFKALGYTLTEDAALLERVGRERKWKIRVSTMKETIVKPAPQRDWKSFLNQHVRWNRGGFYSTDLMSGISYGFIVLYLVLSVLVVPAGFFWGFLLMLPATSFIFPGLLAFVAGLMYERDRKSFLLWFLPDMLTFMLFYSVATVLALFKISVKWKGSKL